MVHQLLNSRAVNYKTRDNEGRSPWEYADETPCSLIQSMFAWCLNCEQEGIKPDIPPLEAFQTEDSD